MAAYAALLSVTHIIDKLQLHPRPPITLHDKQLLLLTQKVTFLQEFLAAYNPRLSYSTEADPLESRIADAAYAAEDVIESLIVDQITNDGEKISSDALYQGLEKVIQDMALIEKEAMEIKGRLGVQHQLHGNSTTTNSTFELSNSMVGVDGVKLQMMDNLTSNRLDLLIIPIVGMGGTGKTTLARNIYQERLITEHFDVCAWAAISQEYSIREIFAQVLSQLTDKVDHDSSEDELGEKLYKHLYGRRYLITMDDMWSIDAWDGVRCYFPDNKNGSRIVVTTRLSNLACDLPNSNTFEMELLDEANSWDLLSRTVFGEKDCPLHLEEIGKKIGKSCKGLPLSIVVIGGLLAKSKHTREFWEYVEENLSTVVNLEDDERCLKILHLSYKQLPVYLKPCFLYMGVFPKDEVIRAARVIRLWVAEGFLKPASGKTCEEIAKEYLKDLADRNLVMIQRMGSIGSIKQCEMHDLLRDLCLREARKERFYTVVGRSPTPQGISNTRRCVVIPSTSEEEASAVQSMPGARSLIWGPEEEPPLISLRLLRIFQSNKSLPYPENMLQLVNLRHIGGVSVREEKFLSSIHRFWNLETLIIKGEFALPAEIWHMPQIRHVEFENVHLPDPPTTGRALGDLHTLEKITNFKCSEEVVKRIPNIKKLGVIYTQVDERLGLDNLVCFDKLESLNCRIPSCGRDSLESLRFPQSLKKLSLQMGYSPFWQDVLEKIGTLPHLEKLRLDRGRFEERKWETVEGQFRSLRFLEISRSSLVEWTTESSHFPRLEKLVLRRLYYLEEIPLEIAEVPTLGSIYFVFGHTKALYSLKRIVETQEESYGEVGIQVVLRLKIHVLDSNAVRECRESPYIRFERGANGGFDIDQIALAIDYGPD